MVNKKSAKPLLLLGALVLAGTFTVTGIVLAQPQPQLTSAYVKEALPLTDPTHAFWQTVPAVAIPLTAQAAVPPTLARASVSTVRVRSANDGQWISFMVEWDDTTKDAFATRPDQFRDAAAIQLPVDTSVPGVCMGVRGKPVDIWHWKADWQEDIDKGFRDIVDAYPNFWLDYYPFAVGKPPYRMPQDFASADARAYLAGWAAGNPLSQPVRVTPVEEMEAVGFGSSTSKAKQGVLGRGVWDAGKWRVVFSRPLASGESGAMQFKAGQPAYVAFAVWNGSAQDVGARKQLSSDMTVAVQPAPPQEVVREVTREVTKEVIREVPKEVIREVTKEVIKEVPREVVKEVPVGPAWWLAGVIGVAGLAVGLLLALALRRGKAS